jgi:hypothetical protein
MNELRIKKGISLSKQALCQHIGIDYDSPFVLIHPEVPTEFMQQSNSENDDFVKDRHEYKMLNKALEVEKLQKKWL